MGILGFGSFRDKFTTRYNRKLTDSGHGYVACFDITPIVVNALKISTTPEIFAINFIRGMSESNEVTFLRSSRPTILRYTLDNKSPRAKRQTQLRRMIDVPIICRTTRDFSILARDLDEASVDRNRSRVEEISMHSGLSFANRFKKSCTDLKKLRIIDVVDRIKTILLNDDKEEDDRATNFSENGSFVRDPSSSRLSKSSFSTIALDKTEFDYDEGEGEIKAINWLMDQRRYKTKLIMSRDNDVFIYVLSKLMTNPAIVVSSVNLLVYHERSNDVLSCWKDFESRRSKCWAFILWLSICFGNDYASGILATNLDSIDTYFLLLKKIFFQISNFLFAYDADTRVFYSDMYSEDDVEEKRREYKNYRSFELESIDDNVENKRKNNNLNIQRQPKMKKIRTTLENDLGIRPLTFVESAADNIERILSLDNRRKTAVSALLAKFVESRKNGENLKNRDRYTSDTLSLDANLHRESIADYENRYEDEEDNLNAILVDRNVGSPNESGRSVWLRRTEISRSNETLRLTRDNNDNNNNNNRIDGSFRFDESQIDDNFTLIKNKYRKSDRIRNTILAITDAVVTLQKIIASVRYADKYKISDVTVPERDVESHRWNDIELRLESRRNNSIFFKNLETTPERKKTTTTREVDRDETKSRFERNDTKESVNIRMWLARHLWSLLYSIELPKYFRNDVSFLTIPSIKINSPMPMPFLSKETFLSLSKLEIENCIKSILCHGVE